MNEKEFARFGQWMEESYAQMVKQQYETAIPLLQQAEQLLLGVKEADLIDWTFLYDYLRQSLWELGRRAEALQVCQKAVRRLGQEVLWPYLEEQNPIRNTLRISHSMLAYDLAEKATDLAGLLPAINHIEYCFSIISPIEDDPLRPFYETKALIYQKAFRYDPEKYGATLGMVLRDIQKQKIAITEKAVLADLASETPPADTTIDAVVHTPANETWQQALQRCTVAFEKLANEDTAMKSKGSVTEEEITHVATLHFMPDSLREMYRKAGNGYKSIDAGDWGFELYSLQELKPLLNEMYFWVNGDENPSVTELTNWFVHKQACFTEEEMAFINEHYRVFGCYWFSEECPCYLFYGKNGKYGALIFNQDEWELKHLADTGFFLLRYATVDELLSRLVTVVIHNDILEDWSIYDEEAHTLLDKAGHQQ